MDVREIVVSIPHTGTHFVMKRLNIKEQYHSWIPWDTLVEHCMEATNIVVPMRDPRKVLETWAKRGRLTNWHGVHDWYRSWYQMQALDAMFDLDIICVDQHSDSRIKDWRPVASNPRPIPPESDLKRIEWKSMWNLPIIHRYYRRPR